MPRYILNRFTRGFIIVLGAWLAASGTAGEKETVDPAEQELAFQTASQAADRPGWRAGALDPISPEDASQFLKDRGAYFKSRISAPAFKAAFSTTSEYSQLALALENDPLRIYQYVRNHFEYVPYFGALKGPYLTMHERSGNDFDQSALLVELLRAAGYDAKYRYGIARFQTNDPLQLERLAKWLGVDEDKWIIRDTLKDGGVPRNLTEDTLIFSHVWVEADIDGNIVLLDPSFKPSERFSEIDVLAAMGHVPGGVLYSASGGMTSITHPTTGVNSISGMNEAGIDSYLTARSTQLMAYLKTHHPNDSVEDVIGGYRITPDNTNTLPVTLPYQAFTDLEWPDAFTDIPDNFVHFLGIATGSIGIIKRIPDIAGRKVSLGFIGGTVAILAIDDEVEAIETAAPSLDMENKLVLTVLHPYPDTFANQTVEYDVKRTGSYALVSGFGGEKHSTLIAERQRLLGRMSLNETAENEPQRLFESLNIIGLSWMRQTQLNSDIQDAIAGIRTIRHHRFGLVAQEEGYYIDVKAQFASAPKRIVADKKGTFLTDGLFSSAMEHSVLEQLQGISNPGISTVKLIALNNAIGARLFRMDNSNVGATKNELENYDQGVLESISKAGYAQKTVVVPEYGSLGLNAWSGAGYVVYKGGPLMELEMAISAKGGPEAHGGHASIPKKMSPKKTQTKNANVSFVDKSKSRTPVRDPVDLGTGAFFSDTTDLSLGGGGARGLSFTRSYDSQQASRNTAFMGAGWTHNYNSYISRHSDAANALGESTPFAAVPFIVANYEARLLMEGAKPPLENWGVSALIANWAMDQLLDKTATLHVGSQALSYQEMPDGTYIPPAGVTAGLTRFGNHHLLSERSGAVTVFNNDDRIEQHQDADGNMLQFSYVFGSVLLGVQDMYGRSLTLNYSGDRLSSVADSTGRSVSYHYTQDAEENLRLVVGLQNAWWGYLYDDFQRLETVTDPLGKTIVDNTYDDFDRVIEQVAPREFGSQTYKMHYAGVLSSEEDPAGNRTTYYYDVNGRKVAIENALGDTSHAVYDGQGQVIESIDPRGNSTTYAYDGNNNLKEKINSNQQKIVYEYDDKHRLLVVTDPLEHKSFIDYDTENHPTHQRDDLGNEAITTYLADGLVDTVEDARGTVTAFTYDGAGNLNTTKVGSHPAIDWNYNGRGYLDSLIDQTGAVTSFIYDTRGLVTQRTDPLGKKSFLSYDPKGRLENHTDRNQDEVTSTYTDTDKLDVVTYEDGSSVNFNYDAHDNLEEMVDPSGTTLNTFDEVNRLTGHTDPNGNLVRYEYDAAGNMTKLTYPDGKSVTYTYDTLNRLADVSIDWLSKTMSYDYDEANRLTDINHFNGMHTGIALDDANRLTGLVHDGNGTLVSYSYGLDENGNRVQETINQEPIPPARLVDDTLAFNYNTKRNRLQSTNNSTFLYDFEGQQTDKDGTSYQFDYAHRLVQIGNDRSFVYDGMGNRIRATRNGVQSQYIYDASGNLIAEDNGSGFRYYIYGKGLTAMITAGGDLYVYHFDGTGHTVAMTNGARVPVNRYAYSPYGEVLGELEQVPQPFKYAGQVGIFAEGDDIYYMRARYYNAETGRFISEDPAGFDGGINLFAYAGGNPTNYVDPNGRNPILFGAIIGGVAGGFSACLDGCDWKDALIGIGTGAVSGAISPLSTARTVGGALLKGAALSGGANALGQGIDIASDANKTLADVNLGSLAGATLGGAFAGKLTQSHPLSFSGQFGSAQVIFGQANAGSLIGGALFSGRATGAQGGTCN